MVYVVWGTSYLAMKVALGGFPPMLLTGLRTSFAGAVLWALLGVRGGRLSGTGWVAEAASGVLIVTLGGTLLAAGLRAGGSGMAAIMFSVMPIFTCLLGNWRDGEIPRLRWIGSGFGAAGIMLMTWNASSSKGGPGPNAMVLGSALATSVGTLWLTRTRRSDRPRPGPTSLLAFSARQLLIGGAATIAIALALGERVASWPSFEAWWAFAYLVLVVSALGYLAFNHVALQAGPAVATSYAFVNPLVAVALGAVLLGEPLTPFHVVAMGITLLGVVLVLQPPP